MSASDVHVEDVNVSRENMVHNPKMKKIVSSRQSLKAKFDKEYKMKKDFNGGNMSRSNCTSWCDALSMSVTNVNARQAWKNGTEKLSQTFCNVRNTFGTLSQRITKSGRKRQPLINLDSPQTPATPHTRSKAVLGRTPTKLYSPFHIDTPKEKENFMHIQSVSKKSPSKCSFISVRRKSRQNSKDLFSNGKSHSSLEPKLSNDLLQTQLGIYEFQSIANSIVQNDKN